MHSGSKALLAYLQVLLLLSELAQLLVGAVQVCRHCCQLHTALTFSLCQMKWRDGVFLWWWAGVSYLHACIGQQMVGACAAVQARPVCHTPL